MRPIVKAALALVQKIVVGAASQLHTDPNGNLWTRSSDEPFSGARTVDLSGDTSLLGLAVRSVYVGTGGVIIVDCYDIDGTTVLTSQSIKVYDGQCPPFGNVTKIYSTAHGTTATGLWIGV